MKLVNVELRNFRSYKVGQGEEYFSFDLGDGLNLLVGPNNCGKSNLLKAIALALEDVDGSRFDRDADTPHQLQWATPVITLTFEADWSQSVEVTLLRYLEEYERSATPPRGTHAEENRVRFRVKYTKSGGRDEFFVARQAGNRHGDPDMLERCLSQFRKCIRFIYLRSGESLSNFIAGTFRELLNTVLREHLGDRVEDAETKRQEYMEGVRDALLEPLGEHAGNELRKALPEIQKVSIMPFAPPLDQALSDARIRVEDSVETAIIHKGTGVRGALLVALLSYLAEHSLRSVVFAVEEPESFLHPAAQRNLRADLGQIAERQNVTLLATTHSPFMLHRSASTRITPFHKTLDGVTQSDESLRGHQPLSPCVKGLFGEAITPSVLDEVQTLAGKAEVVLVVEGETDASYLKLAAERANREELLEAIEIRACQGARDAALQALLLGRLLGDDRVGLLVDWDEHGKSARDSVRKYSNGSICAATYRKWRQAKPSTVSVEAEDMLPAELVEGFLEKVGENGILSEKAQFQDGSWHYGLTQEAKQPFMEFLASRLTEEHTSGLTDILTFWHGKLSS